MRKFISIAAAVAAMTVLMMSCSKLNNTVERVDALEGKTIPTLAEQIVSIEASAVELANVQAVLNKKVNEIAAVDSSLVEVVVLACTDLDTRVTELHEYTEELNKGTRTWAEGTFSTLEQYAKTMETLNEVYAEFNKVRAEFELVYGAIDDTKEDFNALVKKTAEDIKGWVSESFKDYYTAKQIDAIVLDIEEDYTEEVEALREEVEDALEDVETAYKQAIKTAIEEQAGVFDEKLEAEVKAVNAHVDSLADRVFKLESTVWDILNFVETITYLPTFDDGAIHVEFVGEAGHFKADTIAVEYRFSKLPAYELKPFMFYVHTRKVEYTTKARHNDTYPSQIKVDSVKVATPNFRTRNDGNVVRLYLNPVDVNKALNALAATDFTTAISTDFFQWTTLNLGEDVKNATHVVSSAYTPIFFHHDN